MIAPDDIVLMRMCYWDKRVVIVISLNSLYIWTRTVLCDGLALQAVQESGYVCRLWTGAFEKSIIRYSIVDYCGRSAADTQISL